MTVARLSFAGGRPLAEGESPSAVPHDSFDVGELFVFLEGDELFR
jgi:hypothetical protein